MSLITRPLTNAVDTTISEKRPSEHFDTDGILKLRGPTGVRFRDLIHFTRPYPLGSTIFDGTLSLHVHGIWAARTGRQLKVEAVAEDWKVGRVDWDHQPGVRAANVVVVDISNAYLDGDLITAQVQPILQAVSNGTAWYGLRLSLTGTTETNILRVKSGNAARNKPQLSVTWGNPPDPPTDLAPSGGRGVTTDSPLLKFRFHDPDQNVAQSALQIQIDSNPDTTWAAPQFDTGARVTVESQYDLSTDAAWSTSPARPALHAGATWRARVKDTNLWSDWSDAATFVNESSPGTVSLLSPTGGVVHDSTPPIIWTTSFVQAGYRVLVYEDVAPTPRIAVALDDDGVPFLTDGAGTQGADVQFDTDGRPYVPAAGLDVGIDTDNDPYVK